MTVSRVSKWMCCALLAVLVGGFGNRALGQGGGGEAPPLLDAKRMRLQPEEMVAPLKIFGDSSKEGFYMYRNRFGPHQTSRPHYHDKDRWGMVIKGTWYTGEGDVFQPEKMVPIKAGGFMFHPAGLHHYDGSMDDNEVIVQLMGYGPVTSVQTEVDEKGNPIGNNPKNPNRGRGAGAGTPGGAPAGRGRP
jgi:hypothetical protein